MQGRQPRHAAALLEHHPLRHPRTGPFTIAPLTPLPTLTHATIINGYSQPGALPNTLTNGDNAVIEIQLSGGNIPVPTAWTWPRVIVGPLSITGFTNGVHFTDTTGGDLVAGDFIVLRPNAAPAGNSNNGVFIDACRR